jgi:D-3-phosphoglycerate dehydrogenase
VPEKPLILVTERIAEVGLQLLERSCEVCAPWRQDRTYGEEEWGAADAVIVRLCRITAGVLSVAPNLKVIGRHGAGLDNVDLKAATERGIPVVFTPSALTMANAVAEHTVQMMLALARHSVAADKVVREGGFEQRSSLQGVELCQKTLGIIGLGAIGARVAEICHKGLGMRVKAYDPYVQEQPPEAEITLVHSLRELLEQADVVTLHLPCTAETSHMIDAETLHSMKPSTMLINTARGALVDTVALAGALRRGELLGAALDVFEEEPPPLDHPLLSAPRTLFSPHIGSSTGAAMERMAELVARQVVQVLRGERPQFVANPEVFEGGHAAG